MARRPVTDLSAWPSISLEGNLIAPAMLARIDERAAPEQSPEDYGVRKGLTLREEISTAFRVGQSHFDAFSKLSNPSADATCRFVKAFLKETFGFDDIEDGAGLIALSAGGHRIPVIVVPPDEDRLDRRSPTLSVERSRSPAFALQDYLNEEDDALWGLATNGVVIRLMRDNASLTRPAFIEADLAQMFSNEDAASFGLLWLLICRSRFGNAGAPATDCALERWRETGTKEGEVARDRLAVQVKLALNILGSGFLEANPALAAKLQSGEQNLTEWFNELLRLVYRLIFLMVAEDRNLLHPKVSRTEARKLYADGYSLAHLRAQCFRGATWDRHHDRYEGVKIIFGSLAGGQEALALPALGGLFGSNMLPSLETAKLRNRAFMEALYRLSWLQGRTGMSPVNWRAMETEELGSVYESLLELQPQLGDDGKSLVFASDAAEQKGNQRKTTGSYYTPDSLVQALLDTALDPVLDKTEAEAEDPEAALLNLAVIDPACGSGHFLLAAARRIASRVARIRADGTPAQEDFRHALRDVARSCIHGVDRNPMAVELTKVALWIETVDPGLPLGFFDAQIRCGDALLGVFDLTVLEGGIPDAAYKPLTGDDKTIAKYYRDKNKREVKEREKIDSGFGFNRQQDFMREFARLRAMPENTVRQIEAKAEKLHALTAEGATAWTLETACDLYVSAFLLPKTKDDPHAGPDGLPRRGAETVPTSGAVWEWLRGVQLFGPLFANSIDAARKARAFHWPLEFPDIMQRGGFDVVLGNPPWERVEVQEQELFALSHPEIATAKNASERKKKINRLQLEEPEAYEMWQDALRSTAAEVNFYKSSGRFPFGSPGKVNTYAVFVDLARQAIHPFGRAGLIIPNGLVVGFTYREFLGHILSEKSLVSFYGFENEEKIFRAVHNETKFGLLTLGGSAAKVEQPWFTAHIRQPAEIADPEKRYSLTVDEIRAINPNTLNLPAFRWARDAKVTAAIHTAAPILIEKDGNTVVRNDWQLTFKTLFNMATDSGQFIDHQDVAPIIEERRGALAVLTDGRKVYPLYEGKMYWHFDHRYGTYENQSQKQANKGVLPRVPDSLHELAEYCVQPRYWVDARLCEELLEKDSDREWFYTWRDVGPTERSFVGTIAPKVGLGDTSPFLVSSLPPADELALSTFLSTLVVDYALRQKSNRMSFFNVEQLPMLSKATLDLTMAWLGEPTRDWINRRALELFYTSWELKGLSDSISTKTPPYKWDAYRRTVLQAEIDAAVLHLYSLNREQAEWLLDSFTVLRKYEERDHGEFRTKRLVLEAYDAMAKAKAEGVAYQTPLSPPPADISLCHGADESRKPWAEQPIQLPSLEQLPDAIWARAAPSSQHDPTAALAAILKSLDEPTEIRTIRLAAVMMLEPHLLTSLLTGQDQQDWRRLVGQEAEPHTGNVVGFEARTTPGWNAAITNHRGNGRLIEDLAQGTWAPGTGLEAFDTAGWPEGRAKFALTVLRNLDIDTTIEAAPDEIRDWIGNVATG
ncbi:MAG: N-6 DNA methylase [Rhizobiales bacterium]|nr:N-6 DNA methylase [Hyphomicrobiales bacterium]MBO6699334.1 N-6 DNA methylase [Hyphomicrobiales bacterium]MBO6736872.1 N-6 DNA methylase [Hyphomicrobiales bacterium]MBO6912054.1 N-6 DNA methylase [Hyphomicrobiales bacterium]MBO6954578.1 N-6 DNA methylase [Hyphomicrobiales bacterium]